MIYHDISWHFVIKIKDIIFVAKTRNCDNFVAKICDYGLINSFWGSAEEDMLAPPEKCDDWRSRRVRFERGFQHWIHRRPAKIGYYKLFAITKKIYCLFDFGIPRNMLAQFRHVENLKKSPSSPFVDRLQTGGQEQRQHQGGQLAPKKAELCLWTVSHSVTYCHTLSHNGTVWYSAVSEPVKERVPWHLLSSSRHMWRLPTIIGQRFRRIELFPFFLFFPHERDLQYDRPPKAYPFKDI